MIIPDLSFVSQDSCGIITIFTNITDIVSCNIGPCDEWISHILGLKCVRDGPLTKWASFMCMM